MTTPMAFRGEFELRHRTSADSLNFGGVRVPDDPLLSRRRLQEDLQEDEDEDDDAPPDYELDENGSIASLESIHPDKGNKIRFVIIAVLSCVCGISFTLFLFLVPFQACAVTVHFTILAESTTVYNIYHTVQPACKVHGCKVFFDVRSIVGRSQSNSTTH